MTKRDLVVRIADETGLIQQDVAVVLQKTLDYITETLETGETVEFRNFGVFEINTRKARIGLWDGVQESDLPYYYRGKVKLPEE